MATVATVPNRSTLGSYFEEVNTTPLLLQDDEQELAWRVQAGDVEARDQMVRANLRLVVAISRRYLGRGLDLQDLIQEGNLGLVHAVERFDPTRHTRLSTYAKYWIQQSIQKALESLTTPVRVPGYAHDLLIQWRRAVTQLQETLGRHPSEDEVAAHLKLTPRKLNIVRKALKIHNGAPLLGTEREESTDTSLVDHGSESPEAGMVAREEMGQVLQMLDRLEPREAAILRLRFGLSGEEPMALQDIGQRLHLTRERVRQLELKALAKLRNILEQDAA